jgi:hypothetical protein
MRRGYYLSLFAVLAGGVVHADEPSKGHYDLSAEIAWARKRWPDDFKGLHFHSPLAKLLAWVPPGRTVPAFLFTNREFSDTHACRRVELSRGVTESGELLPSLEAKINDRATIEDGTKTRAFTILRVGRWLVQPEYGATYSESPRRAGKVATREQRQWVQPRHLRRALARRRPRGPVRRRAAGDACVLRWARGMALLPDRRRAAV